MVAVTQPVLGVKAFVPDFIGTAFQLSLVATMFAYGLRATVDDVRWLIVQRRLLTKSLLASLVALPVAAVAVELTFPMNEMLRVAILALAACAVPPVVAQQEIKAGGCRPYAMGLTVTGAALSFVLTPLIAAVASFMGRPLATSALGIETAIFRLLLVPLGTGMLLQWAMPLVAERFSAHVLRIAYVLLGGAILLVLFGAHMLVRQLLDVGTVFGMLTFSVAALVIGHFMGGPEPDESLVLAMSCANRHPGVAFAITGAVLPGVNLGAAMLLAMLVSETVSRSYLLWVRRPTTPVALTTAGELLEVDASRDASAAD